jgi:hypothetical protein
MTNTYLPHPYWLPARATNGLAVAAFVLSLFGCFFFSIPFGFVAWHQVDNRNEKGRGLAIASLVISTTWIVFCIAMMIVALFAWTTVTAAPPVYRRH